MTIYFYTRIDEYGDFSNFSSHGFELDGKYWATVEHYYQAQKFAGTKHEEKIRLARTPGDAKSLGRCTKHKLRSDWETAKVEVMIRAVRRKFETHAELRNRLLLTGNEELAENSAADFYWGCGADGSGLNKLGKILMQLREEFRQATSSQSESAKTTE